VLNYFVLYALLINNIFFQSDSESSFHKCYFSGATFGTQKRNFDEIDRNGFGSFVKRNFDEIDRNGFGFSKRNFDEIDRTGFGSFVKRAV